MVGREVATTRGDGAHPIGGQLLGRVQCRVDHPGVGYYGDVIAWTFHLRLAERDLIPETIIVKPPSAELRPDQLDTDSLPPYDLLDPVLEEYVERDRPPADLLEMGFDRAVIERVVQLVDRSEYKRRQAPPGVRISTRAFGKDRRLPITNLYKPH